MTCKKKIKSIVFCVLMAFASQAHAINKDLRYCLQPKPETSMQIFKKFQKPSKMVIGIECRTSNDPTKGPIDIPRLWEKFYTNNVLSQIPNRVSDAIIALYCDYEGDHTKPYSCVIGCEVSSIEKIPEGMVYKIIPASTFALFTAKGEFPLSLIHTWGHIWKSDLPRTYAGDYEIYEKKFASSQEVDVLVAISD